MQATGGKARFTAVTDLPEAYPTRATAAQASPAQAFEAWRIDAGERCEVTARRFQSRAVAGFVMMVFSAGLTFLFWRADLQWSAKISAVAVPLYVAYTALAEVARSRAENGADALRTHNRLTQAEWAERGRHGGLLQRDAQVLQWATFTGYVATLGIVVHAAACFVVPFQIHEVYGIVLMIFYVVAAPFFGTLLLLGAALWVWRVAR